MNFRSNKMDDLTSRISLTPTHIKIPKTQNHWLTFQFLLDDLLLCFLDVRDHLFDNGLPLSFSLSLSLSLSLKTIIQTFQTIKQTLQKLKMIDSRSSFSSMTSFSVSSMRVITSSITVCRFDLRISTCDVSSSVIFSFVIAVNSFPRPWHAETIQRS